MRVDASSRRGLGQGIHKRLVSGSKQEDELRRVWKEVRRRWLEPLRCTE